MMNHNERVLYKIGSVIWEFKTEERVNDLLKDIRQEISNDVLTDEQVLNNEILFKPEYINEDFINTVELTWSLFP